MLDQILKSHFSGISGYLSSGSHVKMNVEKCKAGVTHAYPDEP